MKRSLPKLILLFLLFMFSSIIGRADTLLTNPTEQQFANALNAGGLITFSGNTTLTLANTYTLQKDTVIDAKNFTLDLNISKPFIIIPTNLVLAVSGVRVQNCNINFSNGGVFVNQGTLTLTNSTFSSNNFSQISLYQPLKGGVIYNAGGVINIYNCFFTGNKSVTLTGTPIHGGVIYNDFGTLNISGSTVSGNSLSSPAADRNDPGTDGYGAGIYSSGFCFINQCSFVGNSINGNSGSLAYNVSRQSRGGAIYSSGTLIITNSSLLNNSALLPRGTSLGGAIAFSGSLSISHSTLFQNFAGGGGAIYSEGDCSLEQTILQENSANTGGAVHNAGILKLNSSTLANNVSTGKSEYVKYITPILPGPTISAENGSGGGIYNTGQINSTNSTFFGNAAVGGTGYSLASGSGLGGAVYSVNASTPLKFFHVTFQSNRVSSGSVAGNSSSGSANGSTFYNGGSASVFANTIVSGGNTNAIWGSVTDYGNNICFDASANLTAAGSYNSQDANLGQFGTFGGYTPTVMLKPGSIAIDHAYPPFVPPTDQRGVGRDRTTADIGAFEFVPIPITQPSLTPTNVPVLFPGTVLHLFGANLLYATNLNISGVDVDFAVISDTELTLSVPTLLESGTLEVRTLTGVSASGPAVRSWIEIIDVSMTNRNLIVKFKAATNAVDVKLSYGSTLVTEFSQTKTTGTGGTNTVQFSITNVFSPTFAAKLQFIKDSYVSVSPTYSLSLPPPRIQFTDWNVTFSSATTASINVTLESEISGSVNLRYGRLGSMPGYLPPLDRQVTAGTQSLNFNLTGLVPGTSNIVFVEFQYLNSNFLYSSPTQAFAVPLPFRDQALSFSAGSQFVAISHKPSLNAFPLTISGWFKTSQTIGYVGLVSKFEPGSSTGYQVSIIDGVLRAFYLKDVANKVTEAPEGISGGPVADGNWHHVDFVVGSDGSQLFLDGVLKKNLPWTGVAGPTSSTAPLRFGYYYNGFEGQLDEIELWNKAKTPSEVAKYNIPPDSADPLLLGYWKFNQGIGTTLVDSTTNGNDGQINGGVAWTISGAPVARKSSLQLGGSGSLAIAGSVGATFVLEQSINLINWTPSSTNQFDATGYSSLTLSPAGPMKFLRVKNP